MDFLEPLPSDVPALQGEQSLPRILVQIDLSLIGDV